MLKNSDANEIIKMQNNFYMLENLKQNLSLSWTVVSNYISNAFRRSIIDAVEFIFIQRVWTSARLRLLFRALFEEWKMLKYTESGLWSLSLSSYSGGVVRGAEIRLPTREERSQAREARSGAAHFLL